MMVKMCRAVVSDMPPSKLQYNARSAATGTNSAKAPASDSEIRDSEEAYVTLITTSKYLIGAEVCRN